MDEKPDAAKDLYMACRPDGINPRVRVFLSQEMTWTRNECLAHLGYLDSMLAIVQKIRHAYPDLFLEKVASQPGLETELSG